MKQITTDELVSLRTENGNFALINVMPEEEFAAGHIPGSENVPLTVESFASQMRRKLPGKKTRIVVYGADARSEASSQAATTLERLEFANVYHYRGGLSAWRDAGLEVARGPSA